MKKLFLASAFAAALAMGLPMAAQADTKVRVYLGLPHYGYQVGPDYRFRDAYGWYRPVGVYNRGRLSCSVAVGSGTSTPLSAMAARIPLKPPAGAVM